MIKTEAERQAQCELEHANQLLTQQDKLANLRVITSNLGHEIANPIITVSSSGTVV